MRFSPTHVRHTCVRYDGLPAQIGLHSGIVSQGTALSICLWVNAESDDPTTSLALSHTVPSSGTSHFLTLAQRRNRGDPEAVSDYARRGFGRIE